MPSTADPKPVRAPHRLSLLAAGISLAVLLSAGAGHRALLARIETALGTVQQLERPLSSVPLQVGAWAGVDEPIDEHTRKIAGDDDALNRTYRRAEDQAAVGVYVGYIGRPRKWLGHRPDVCYRAHGYEQVGQETGLLALPDGAAVPCFTYEFRAPALGGPRQLVLATYIVNGEYVAALEDVKEMNARRLDFTGSRPTYLVRIQVNTAATGDRARDLKVLEAFASELQEHILDLLPAPALAG